MENNEISSLLFLTIGTEVSAATSLRDLSDQSPTSNTGLLFAAIDLKQFLKTTTLSFSVFIVAYGRATALYR